MFTTSTTAITITLVAIASTQILAHPLGPNLPTRIPAVHTAHSHAGPNKIESLPELPQEIRLRHASFYDVLETRDASQTWNAFEARTAGWTGAGSIAAAQRKTLMDDLMSKMKSVADKDRAAAADMKSTYKKSEANAQSMFGKL